jgi:hypothetical protein
MKKITQLKMGGILLAASLGTWGILPAETVVTERTAPATASTTTATTTTSDGSFTEFAPGTETMTMRTEAGPTQYVITKHTEVVDETGAPMTITKIAPGRPLAVHYIRENGHLVASRVVVRGPAPPVAVAPAPAAEVTTTRTTTTEMPGTITEFTPGNTVIVRGDARAEPQRYIVNKTTTYVDETGAPIPAERIIPGAPVTVHYLNEGGHMVANQIVVRSPRDVSEERRDLKKEYHREKERLEHEEKDLKREERRERD